MNILLLIVPLAPLMAALLILVFGQRLVKAGYFSIAGTAVALVALLLLSGSEPNFQMIWLETAGFKLSIGLSLDGLSRFMALLVASIALLVSIYATEDMAEEAGQSRFFWQLSFFVGAMLLLVLANSFVLLYAAWEGVGVASFLLIGFWYDQKDSRQAALKAFLITRLGDLGLFLGWLLALQIVGTTDIATFLATVRQGENPSVLTLLALLFFAGAVGKSAQLPLTSWLPDAMAGPTPVSALIHSATMVAAGVYLVLRLFPLFAAAPGALTVVLWVGSATALFAGLVATQQQDLKRVLAWSTVSQLGEMMMALGLGGPLAAAYHLATQAAFKSTLFLAAGAVGLAVETYSLKRFGRLGSRMPLTALTFVAAALSLAGLPPFSAFWSEEAILRFAVAASPGWGILLIIFVFLAGVYISRAAVSTLATWPGAPQPAAHDPSIRMTGSMLLLALAACGLGWALSGRLEAGLGFPSGPELAWGWSLIAVLATLIGLGWGGWHALRKGPAPIFGSFPRVLEQTLDVVTNSPAQLAIVLATGLNTVEAGLDQIVRMLGAATLALADTADVTDTHGISLGVDRLSNLLSATGERLRQLQSGKIYFYTLAVFVWLLAAGIVGALLWR